MNSDYSSDDDKNGEESLVYQTSYSNPIIIFRPEAVMQQCKGFWVIGAKYNLRTKYTKSESGAECADLIKNMLNEYGSQGTPTLFYHAYAILF